MPPRIVTVRITREDVNKRCPKMDRSSDEDSEVNGADDRSSDQEVIVRKRRRSESPSIGDDVSPASSSGIDAVEHRPKKRWTNTQLNKTTSPNLSTKSRDLPDLSSSIRGTKIIG